VKGREGRRGWMDGWRWSGVGVAVCEVGESDGGIFGHVGAIPHGLVRGGRGDMYDLLFSGFVIRSFVCA